MYMCMNSKPLYIQQLGEIERSICRSLQMRPSKKVPDNSFAIPVAIDEMPYVYRQAITNACKIVPLIPAWLHRLLSTGSSLRYLPQLREKNVVNRKRLHRSVLHPLPFHRRKAP